MVVAKVSLRWPLIFQQWGNRWGGFKVYPWAIPIMA